MSTLQDLNPTSSDQLKWV